MITKEMDSGVPFKGCADAYDHGVFSTPDLGRPDSTLELENKPCPHDTKDVRGAPCHQPKR
jgi:hypothetical protein